VKPIVLIPIMAAAILAAGAAPDPLLHAPAHAAFAERGGTDRLRSGRAELYDLREGRVIGSWTLSDELRREASALLASISGDAPQSGGEMKQGRMLRLELTPPLHVRTSRYSGDVPELLLMYDNAAPGRAVRLLLPAGGDIVWLSTQRSAAKLVGLIEARGP
jgi:hypothetical protein